ncbi:MAG: glutamate-1-semialdehyde 2,1-aminomutase [Chloroflexi bacterium]|nr:glutamate-1-semialdehyde 2,1-aminomutase [Chloroflexota bacterium]
MNTERSQALFTEAQSLIPGGVNSPVRAFKSVGGTPRFIDRAEGPYLFDVDGNRYADYVLSWGPLILGHAHPAVVEAICAQAPRGASYGAPTALEVELARLITGAMPSLELIRMVNSGTEATMSALRLARAFTGRAKIIKFAGGYHGHADLLLAQAGSGVATLGLPDSAGVPPSTVADTLTAPYNDLPAVERLLDANRGQVAAIIVEPVAGNMGVVPPQPGFLEGLRALTTAHGALLIFDEVITGFRVGLGGAQALYGVRPDLTCLGKIIGGGLPVGAYGGRRDIMQMIAPSGPVYQAGTLSGNPLAMAAGIATLRVLHGDGVYPALERMATDLCRGIADGARAAGVPVQQNRIGGMFTTFFSETPVTDYESAKRSDTKRYARYFHALLERGVYVAPSQFEAGFVSTAHSDEVIAESATAARAALTSD